MYWSVSITAISFIAVVATAFVSFVAVDLFASLLWHSLFLTLSPSSFYLLSWFNFKLSMLIGNLPF